MERYVGAERPAVSARESEIEDGGFRPVEEIVRRLDDFEMWSQICLRAPFEGALASGTAWLSGDQHGTRTMVAHLIRGVAEAWVAVGLTTRPKNKEIRLFLLRRT